jgi:hypothetical protein
MVNVKWIWWVSGCLGLCFMTDCQMQPPKTQQTNDVWIAFDSLVLGQELVVFASTDTTTNNYCLIARNAFGSDTLKTGTIMSSATFPKQIWSDTVWANQYQHPANARIYFDYRVFQETQLVALDLNGQKPRFVPLDSAAPCISYSGYFVGQDGFEVPIVRGLENGKSIRFDFDLVQQTGLKTTNADILQLLEAIPPATH